MLSFLKRRRFNIGARIFLGFGLVVAIFVGQSVVSNVGFDGTVENFELYGQVNAETTAIMEVERTVLELQRSVLAYT